jgi:transposase
MTQRDRDRLVVLRKAQKKLITQAHAANELGITTRQVKRLLRRLKAEGDKAVIHGLRGRPSYRKLSTEKREKIVRILSQEMYRGFGPTLAGEYLAKKHKLAIGREALRQVMISAGLWQSRRQKVQAVHQWRPRRSCRGELVQWDTSDHDWLEGRGPRLYLIAMIDDATSELTARFAEHDSTPENLRLLRRYLEQHGRPAAFYTDKASLFQTTEKRRRDQPGRELDAVEMPATQICRALRELGITWLAAHSPQAKGRIERSFATAQDRLVKGLRIARVKTLEQANRYLEEDFLAWWNQHLKVLPANPSDAHRPLGVEHDLDAILSLVESRQVTRDYTIQFQSKRYQIAKADVSTGLRGANVQIQVRLDGSVRVSFQGRYLQIEE